MSDDNRKENSVLNTFTADIKTLAKGEDVEEVEQKSLELCQQFLGSIWSQFTVNDIEVKRLTGGMSNKVYHCKAVAKVEDMSGDEPKEVVIRFYGDKYDFSFGLEPNLGRLDEAIVGVLASKNGLGPHVYGVFEDGQIQKYYPHRHFKESDLDDPYLCNELATKIAKFHAMDAPIRRDTRVFETLIICSTRRLTELEDRNMALYTEYGCKTLLEFDMKSEVKWAIDLIRTLDSPIVFVHNDFRLANQLVTEDNEVILNDFEFSAYGYRGFDLAAALENMDKDHPNVRKFITYYVRECEQIFGESYSRNPINSVDHIIGEMKGFSMFYSLSLANIFLHDDIWQLPVDNKTCLILADGLVQKYLLIKKQYINRTGK